MTSGKYNIFITKEFDGKNSITKLELPNFINAKNLAMVQAHVINQMNVLSVKQTTSQSNTTNLQNLKLTALIVVTIIGQKAGYVLFIKKD